MKGGIMNSQRVQAMAGYMPPALPFAQLPNPDSVIGQVYIASNVGPAPGIELIAAPGRWRPRGGRQVLAMRAKNPVTVQSLTNVVAETIGPFPGGLVRAGMRLAICANYAVPGFYSPGIYYTLRVNNNPCCETYITGGNSALACGQSLWSIDVLSDTNAVHKYNYRSGSFVDGKSSLEFTPSLDFSSQFDLSISSTSRAETAVNISSITWAGGIATFNTAADHTLAVGDKTVIASVTPSGYNGTFIVATAPTTTQFTVAMAADPGAYTSGGTSSRISNVISQSYVLELVG